VDNVVEVNKDWNGQKKGVSFLTTMDFSIDFLHTFNG
jgi:hypothetical protein